MIPFSASLKAVGGVRSGIAPAHLLDVLDVNNNLYFWSDRPCEAPAAVNGIVDVPAIPPVAPVVGQYVTWSLPTLTNTNSDPSSSAIRGSASARVDGTGIITMTQSCGTCKYWYGAYWSGFTTPPLPSNAQIDAIYPVIIASSQGSPANGFAGQNLNIAGGSPGGKDLGLPSTEFDGQYSASSIGSSIAALSVITVGARLEASTPSTDYRELDISFVGLAIYYSISSGGEEGSSGSHSGYQGSGIYRPWLLDVPQFAFHRSLQTDTGSFVVQNLSGDTLSRDAEKILRASTLEGALFVYRLWQPDAEAAWLEIHGTLTVDPVDTRDLTLKGSSLINAAQDDTPLEVYCETCQLDYGGRRCGATSGVECSYSFPSCQVVERIMVVNNSYEKNFGEAIANVTTDRLPNRRRKI